ncbi:MAG: hypothetical protein IJW64_02110 [Clostridia bacterium]|nr:hypothetical protein [Clostridia bacterium]
MIEQTNLLRTKILAEETEKRVTAIEKADGQKDKTKDIEETAVLNVKNQRGLKSYIEINCKETTGISYRFSASIKSGIIQTVIFYGGGKQLGRVSQVSEASQEFPLLLQKGKNLLYAQCSFPAGQEPTELTYSFNVKGKFNYELKDDGIELLGQKYIVKKYGDTITFYNAETLEGIISYVGGKDFSCALLSNDRVGIVKNGYDGSEKIECYNADVFTSSSSVSVGDEFTKSAIRKYGDFYAVYLLKGNTIYERLYTDKSTYSQTKLPFRAKNIGIFPYEDFDYFYYTDLSDNFIVCQIEKEKTFTQIWKYPCGKIKKARLYEAGTVIFVSYKIGEIVVEKALDSNSVNVLGVGDDAVRLSDGTLIIRRNNELIKI